MTISHHLLLGFFGLTILPALALDSAGGGFETLEIPARFRGVAFVTWQETENTASLRIAVP